MATAVSMPSPELSGLQSPESVAILDWQATLSPSRRSCIKLSNVEPCVNKAIAHLTTVKAHLVECTQEPPPGSTTLQRPGSQLDTPTSIQFQHTDGEARRSKSDSSSRGQLMVEGVTTGITVEKPSKSSARAVRL